MSKTLPWRSAAFLGFLAVGLAAFGAHGLKELLARNGTAIVWERAVLFHFVHVLMLFVLAGRPTLARGPWFSFFAGIILFSGSLYLLAVTNVKWLGAITPFGGISFLIGWFWLMLSPSAREKSN
jgi:uncharacterized membrane protein YgdD (TMEM256/DUF423 family)